MCDLLTQQVALTPVGGTLLEVGGDWIRLRWWHDDNNDDDVVTAMNQDDMRLCISMW